MFLEGSRLSKVAVTHFLEQSPIEISEYFANCCFTEDSTLPKGTPRACFFKQDFSYGFQPDALITLQESANF